MRSNGRACQSPIANYLLATFISNSPAETEAIARQIAEDLVAGSVLALKGELGSGKTLFTQGLVAGLESDAAVTSPTFTIVHEYQSGRLPVYHFDFFRLENRGRAKKIWRSGNDHCRTRPRLVCWDPHRDFCRNRDTTFL